MRRMCALALTGALLLAPPAWAQDHVTYESVTVATTALGITAAIRNPAGRPPQTACQMRLETAQVRFRWDGTDPTSTEGQLLDVGDLLTVRGAAFMAAFRAIRTGGTSGVLKIHCYIDRNN